MPEQAAPRTEIQEGLPRPKVVAEGEVDISTHASAPVENWAVSIADLFHDMAHNRAFVLLAGGLLGLAGHAGCEAYNAHRTDVENRRLQEDQKLARLDLSLFHLERRVMSIIDNREFGGAEKMRALAEAFDQLKAIRTEHADRLKRGGMHSDRSERIEQSIRVALDILHGVRQ